MVPTTDEEFKVVRRWREGMRLEIGPHRGLRFAMKQTKSARERKSNERSLTSRVVKANNGATRGASKISGRKCTLLPAWTLAGPAVAS